MRENRIPVGSESVIEFHSAIVIIVPLYIRENKNYYFKCRLNTNAHVHAEQKECSKIVNYFSRAAGCHGNDLINVITAN